jgi:hypothetical protein
MMLDAFLTSCRLADGRVVDIGIADGKIGIVGEGAAPTSSNSAPALDIGGDLVLPGLVDGHMHLRAARPGQCRPADPGTLRRRAVHPGRLTAGAAPWRTRASARRLPFVISPNVEGSGSGKFRLDGRVRTGFGSRRGAMDLLMASAIRNRKFVDSLLERDGFEPSVPRCDADSGWCV